MFQPVAQRTAGMGRRDGSTNQLAMMAARESILARVLTSGLNQRVATAASTIR